MFYITAFPSSHFVTHLITHIQYDLISLIYSHTCPTSVFIDVFLIVSDELSAMLHWGTTLHIENNSYGKISTLVSIATCFWNLWFSRTQAHETSASNVILLIQSTWHIFKKNIWLDHWNHFLLYEICIINYVYNYTFVHLMLMLPCKCLT